MIINALHAIIDHIERVNVGVACIDVHARVVIHVVEDMFDDKVLVDMSKDNMINDTRYPYEGPYEDPYDDLDAHSQFIIEMVVVIKIFIQVTIFAAAESNLVSNKSEEWVP